MLVVANQASRRIGRERGLTCSRETKEERAYTIGTDVRRAMHREYIPLRQDEVHYTEDRLLDLAGVFRTAYHHQLAAEVRDNKTF